MAQPKTLRAPNLNPPLRRRPFIARRNPQHHNHQPVPILGRAQRLPILRVNDCDQIRHDGEQLLGSVIEQLHGGDIFVFEGDLELAAELRGGIGFDEDLAIDMAYAEGAFDADDFAFEEDRGGGGAADFGNYGFGDGVDSVALAGFRYCSADAP